ncbi:hypothetical protein [Actinoplanes regularis]|uniref:hypothetical protein n=1 Tax=Actinoplanes regularis TaxID=52697 RepID=UPI000B793431|nr:hypothetical protein [Actinoplanes regularis]
MISTSPRSAARLSRATVDRIEQDFRHFAPDLLHWHLPRRPSTSHTALSPRRLSVLVRDDGLVLAVGSGDPVRRVDR